MAATPKEAERLAKDAVRDYLKACGVSVLHPDVGNYLMKLTSVTGVLMSNAEGSDVAADRLFGTAQFILKTMPTTPVGNADPLK